MTQSNKAYWTGREVTGYGRKQRLLIPRKDEVLDTIVHLVPFDEEQAFCVVDVGAGQGALSERILRRFERAHVVLFDASAEMLAVAAQRLAGFAPRFSAIAGDFNGPTWYGSISRPVHAIVSAIALHYLRTERRAPFFSGVYERLESPGYFANAGTFDTEHAFVQAYCDNGRIAYTQKQLLELEGREVPLNKLRRMRETESEKAGVNQLRLGEQTKLLEDAGFDHVEVVWRYLSMAVVVGYKS